ncbi:MAG TPA: PPOX class F420-dependent oxidoreductase [Anaerolineales bacterium]|nr:PPOX class F420-dependent oxidoreductase [Anaerolineales bacterium]
MTTAIPAELADLLTREKRAFAHLALTLNDGTPQVTPVWFDWDGEHLIVNTARGRVKDNVLRRHPVVAVAISDPHDPYRYLQIKGAVVAEDEADGRAMIDSLSQKYLDKPYPFYRGETRVTYRIKPTRVQTNR